MIEELIKSAISARENSYSPYSKFRVGASVLMENGNIYSGCNIENAAYSPTICAERVAIFKGVFDGNRKILKLAVVGDSEETFPCGVCRQVIREFATKETEIIVIKSEKDYEIFKLDELLPKSFGPEDLEEK